MFSLAPKYPSCLGLCQKLPKNSALQLCGPCEFKAGEGVPASSVITVSSSQSPCLENRPKTQREEGCCSQSDFLFLCTGSSYSRGNASQSRSGDGHSQANKLEDEHRGERPQSFWPEPPLLADSPCMEELSQDQQTRSYRCLRWGQRGHPAGSRIFRQCVGLEPPSFVICYSRSLWPLITDTLPTNALSTRVFI